MSLPTSIDASPLSRTPPRVERSRLRCPRVRSRHRRPESRPTLRVACRHPSARCRISGRLASGTTPLPGASIIVSLDNSPRAITSSDVDGTYVVQLSPGATYRLAADLAGFSTIERTIDLTAPACDQTIDLQLVLQPRRPAGQTPPTGSERRVDGAAPAGSTRAALSGIERSGRRGRHYARDCSHARVRGRCAAASAGILPRGCPIRRDRDRREQQRHQSRPRAAQRSTRSDHARPVRSGDRSVRARVRAARWRRRSRCQRPWRSPRWRIRARRRTARRRTRTRWTRRRAGRLPTWRPRRAGAESVSGIGQLHVRRVGPQQSALSTAPGGSGHAAAVRTEQFRGDVRRSAHDPRRLCQHQPSHDVPGELLGEPVRQSLRSVRHRADRGDARGRLL